jgi:hypothetical protein
MNPRIRKLIGAIVLLVFIPIWAVVTVTFAVARLPETSILTHTLYFAIMGILWVVPAGLVIRWMLRERA